MSKYKNLRKYSRAVMVGMIALGSVLLISDLFNIINLLDILQMYSMALIAIGVIWIVLTTEHIDLNEDTQRRITVQQRKLFNKAQRDLRREEKRERKLANRND